MRASIAIFIVCLGLNHATQAAWAECADILRHGIWEYRETQSKKFAGSSYLHWFCSQEFSSSKSANDTGVEFGIPIENIPVNFKGHDRNENWSEYQKALCERTETEFVNSEQIGKIAITASPAVTKAWEACTQAIGAKAWVGYSDNPLRFSVTIKYTPDGEKTVVKLQRGGWTVEPSTVTCNPDFKIKGNRSITLERTTICTRKKNEPVDIAIYAIPKVQPSSLKVAALPPPPVCKNILKPSEEYVFSVSRTLGGRLGMLKNPYVVKFEKEIDVEKVEVLARDWNCPKLGGLIGGCGKVDHAALSVFIPKPNFKELGFKQVPASNGVLEFPIGLKLAAISLKSWQRNRYGGDDETYIEWIKVRTKPEIQTACEQQKP